MPVTVRYVTTYETTVRRKRPNDPTLLFAIFAVLGFGGAIAAYVAHRANTARVAAYHADRHCATPLTAEDVHASMIEPAGACTLSRATTTAKWIHSYKGSKYYRLAVTTPGGQIDSVELKGDNARLTWDVASAGNMLFAESFVDPATRARHVTAVRGGSAAVPTGWNPDYRAKDTMVGVVFLTLLGIGGAIGAIVSRMRRTQL